MNHPSSTLRQFLACLLLLGGALALAAPDASAHPHSFLETCVTFEFNGQGLAGMRQTWTIDEMTSFTVLDAIGENGDGVLSPEEVRAIEELNKNNLETYAYFTFILVNGEPYAIGSFEDFDAKLADGELVYTFFTPCPVAATAEFQEAQLCVADQSFYCFILYVGKEGSNVDPFSDPMFANTEAPLAATDYGRFSDSVGLGDHEAEFGVLGPIERFTIERNIAPEPKLAYLDGAITPDALSVRFKLP